jgi:hypothetical protein
LPVELTICQTNDDGKCINPIQPGAISEVIIPACLPNPDPTKECTPPPNVTFSIFIRAKNSPIPFDPANNRVFLIATPTTSEPIPVGQASAAIRTQ